MRALAIWALGTVARAHTEESGPSEQPPAYALFTHANGELHCMDRELRHPCVPELRTYIEDKSIQETKAAALQCIQEVLQTSNDFWELKNMTHLLLDLDTVEHVFDKSSRDNEFIQVGLDFADRLIRHPECMAEFDSKAELECRCVPLYAKVKTLKLKNAGKWEEAQSFYEEMKQLAWNGEKSFPAGQALKWDDFQHTPQIVVQGLRSMPVWPKDTWVDLPICQQLEDNFETIREETAKALLNEAENGFEGAYRFLYDKGEWNRVLLYHDKAFTEECERVFPKTCALLKQWLPSKPGLPWTSNQNEQVMILKMKVGTDVEIHSGPSNNILNIHMGISGLQGAVLMVANQTYSWEEGKVIAWDGSYDHRVHCLDCVEDRVIIMVRYMHPDMSPAHYKGNHRTQYDEIPELWQ